MTSLVAQCARLRLVFACCGTGCTYLLVFGLPGQAWVCLACLVKDQHVDCALTAPALLPQHTGHVGDARIAQAPAQIGLVPHRHHGRTGPADEAFVKNDVLLNRAVVFVQVVVADPALPAIRTLNLCSFASTGNDLADHKRIVAANMHHIAGLKHWKVSRDYSHPSLLHCAAKFAGCDKLAVDLLDNWVLHVWLVGCTIAPLG